MTKKLSVTLTMLFALIMLLMPTLAFATSTAPVTKDQAVNNAIDDAAPAVTIGEAEDWSERKGFEVVGLLQKIAEPFTIIIFIFGGFMFIVGTLGKSSMAAKGLITMAFAGIGYACIIYAPDLISSFLYWIKN